MKLVPAIITLILLSATVADKGSEDKDSEVKVSTIGFLSAALLLDGLDYNLLSLSCLPLCACLTTT